LECFVFNRIAQLDLNFISEEQTFRSEDNTFCL
jgi:hypothetical protein